MTTRRWLSRYAIFIALAVECVVLGFATDTFLTSNNLLNVLRQNAFPAIIAAGMTFVILTGGIDLSVGSVVGLAGVLCADAMVHGWSIPAAIALGIAVGLAVGALNGIVVTRIGVPPFIVTLATMLVVRGAAFKYTDARTISGLTPGFSAISQSLVMAALMALVYAIAWVLLRERRAVEWGLCRRRREDERPERERWDHRCDTQVHEEPPTCSSG